MKTGFYLSPDGLHIVEILFEEPCHVVNSRVNDFDDFIFDCFVDDLPVIFGCWEYLGE